MATNMIVNTDLDNTPMRTGRLNTHIPTKAEAVNTKTNFAYGQRKNILRVEGLPIALWHFSLTWKAYWSLNEPE